MAVDASVVKKTQDSLGKIIKKPPLTEKLLSKPPFRYLHDIISEVTKASGFLEGLYSGNELSSANIKDKEAKIAYLQKAIDAVGFTLETIVSVRPSKIIAGQEPDRTNDFLQALGKAALKGVNAEAVDKVQKGEKPSKKTESSKEKVKPKDRRSSKEKGEDKSKERDSSKGRGREKDSTSKERANASRSKERPGRDRKSRDDVKTRDSAGSKERRKEPESASKERKRRKDGRPQKEEREPGQMQPTDPEQSPHEPVDAPAPAPESEQEPPTTNGFHEQEKEGGDVEESPPPVRIPRPSSAKGQRRRPKEESHHEAENVPDERKTYAEAVAAATTSGPPVPITQGKRRERPTSARPAPPKIKKQDDEPEETVRQHSGRPTAGLIVDNERPPEDDDMFVNEETEEMPMMPVRTEPVVDDGQHGGLVQKILDTQKNYANENEQEDEKKERAPLMNQAARQKERDLVKKEIDVLKSGIQTLASSAAPLGKILDYMQEDLDSMQKELEIWRSENRYHETAINAEESHMEKTLEPLRDQLSEIEHHFNDQINKINAMKANISHNDEKIAQMLSTMSFTTS